MDPRTQLPIVGMVGGGQLARMTHQAAIALGQSLRVLSERPDDSAALVAADVRIGSHTSYDDLAAFSDGCDVVTFDHEHVPAEHLRALQAAGVVCHPHADALLFAQDKLAMRARLTGIGAPVPRWAQVESAADLIAFAGGDFPVVLKTSRGGYDGKGVWFVTDEQSAHDAVAEAERAGVPLLAEAAVPLRRELAVLIARSPFGQVAVWPVVETVQQDGICVEVIAPAPGLPDALAAAATELAIRIAGELDVTGVLAVELFQERVGTGAVDEAADRLVVNELAMRPHNSGHWTIDGSVTSQFEQHLRAVLDYPLGDVTMRSPYAVMANVLGGEPGEQGIDERIHHLMARWPDVKIHLYGKQVRPGRKIGHVNVTGSDLPTLRRRATAAAHYLRTGEIGETEDGTA